MLPVLISIIKENEEKSTLYSLAIIDNLTYTLDSRKGISDYSAQLVELLINIIKNCDGELQQKSLSIISNLYITDGNIPNHIEEPSQNLIEMLTNVIRNNNYEDCREIALAALCNISACDDISIRKKMLLCF
jgi:hypothetical protein